MPRINELPYREVERGDTLSLHTRVPYDPTAPRPTTPIMVGKHVVARRPVPNTMYTLYMILDGSAVCRSQISYPSVEECDAAVTRHRAAIAREAAGNDVKRVIAKARKPTPLRIREHA